MRAIEADCEWDLCYDGFSDGFGLQISNSRKVFGIKYPSGLIRPFPFSALIDAEPVIDDAAVTKTNRGSQVAWAAAGGILLGPAGLLIGGLTGSKRVDHTRIKKLAIRLTVRSLSSPSFQITFWDDPEGTKATNPYVQARARELHEWIARLRTIQDIAGRTPREEHDDLPETDTRLDVVLTKKPGFFSKSDVQKPVQSITALGFSETATLLWKLPAVILRNVDEYQAEDAKRRLEACGGTVELRSSI